MWRMKFICNAKVISMDWSTLGGQKTIDDGESLLVGQYIHSIGEALKSFYEAFAGLCRNFIALFHHFQFLFFKLELSFSQFFHFLVSSISQLLTIHEHFVGILVICSQGFAQDNPVSVPLVAFSICIFPGVCGRISDCVVVIVGVGAAFGCGRAMCGRLRCGRNIETTGGSTLALSFIHNKLQE
jgi:hypothetical protein